MISGHHLIFSINQGVKGGDVNPDICAVYGKIKMSQITVYRLF